MPPRRPAKTQTAARDNSARTRVVDEARRLFLAQGFRGVTMDDLATQLGMSKKTLYAAFPSKAELLKAVIQDKFASLDADLAAVFEDASTDVPTLFRELLVALQRQAGEIQPAFLRDLSKHAPEVFRLVEKRRRQVIQQYFGKALERGRKSGVIRADIPPDLLMEILLGAVQSVMTLPKMTDLGLTPKSSVSAIVSVFLEGVFTDKGRARQ